MSIGQTLFNAFFGSTATPEPQESKHDALDNTLEEREILAALHNNPIFEQFELRDRVDIKDAIFRQCLGKGIEARFDETECNEILKTALSISGQGSRYLTKSGLYGLDFSTLYTIVETLTPKQIKDDCATLFELQVPRTDSRDQHMY